MNPIPESDRDFIARTVRWLLTGLLVAVVLLILLRVLRAALTPLAVAFVLAYLLDPVIDRFESSGVRRSVTVLTLIFVFGAGLSAILLVIIPRLISEATALAAAFPGYLETLSSTLIPKLSAKLGIEIPSTLTDAMARVRSGEIPLPFDSMAKVLRNALSYLTGTASSVVGLLVIPILSYYMLVEFDRIVARIGRWVPPRHRAYVDGKARLVDSLISSFLRGQLVVATILGALYAAGFSVIGIDLAVSVGIIAGILSIIPYIGSAFALVVGAALAFLKFGPGAEVLWVVGWYAVVQALEGLVITPRVQGQSIGLHPAVVIVALLIGGDLFGLLGLLVAVPAAAVIKVFAEEIFALYRASTLFGPEEERV